MDKLSNAFCNIKTKYSEASTIYTLPKCLIYISCGMCMYMALGLKSKVHYICSYVRYVILKNVEV